MSFSSHLLKQHPVLHLPLPPPLTPPQTEVSTTIFTHCPTCFDSTHVRPIISPLLSLHHVQVLATRSCTFHTFSSSFFVLPCFSPSDKSAAAGWPLPSQPANQICVQASLSCTLWGLPRWLKSLLLQNDQQFRVFGGEDKITCTAEISGLKFAAAWRFWRLCHRGTIYSWVQGLSQMQDQDKIKGYTGRSWAWSTF